MVVSASPYEENVERGSGVGKGIITPENMPIMHEKLLETVKYFDEFCRKNNLTYCLLWGSLIGAVRHKGFVPWDDDMDVAMPRDDYEKLFQLWECQGDKKNYALYRTTAEYCAKVPIGLLRNKNTTVIYEFNKDEDIAHGVKLDIEPWDEVPNNRLQQYVQKFWFRIFEVYATQRLPISSPELNRFKNLKITIIKTMLSLVKGKKARFAIASRALKHATKYNGKDCTYVRCNASTKPSKKLDVFRTIRVPFEDTELSISSGYDSILRQEYGNYMEKPRVISRKPCIAYVFYDLNNSYTKYKGKYYCTK